MSTQEIYNFQRVDDRIITGGQPTEAQLRDAAEDGIQVVINLAAEDPHRAIADEDGTARSLGLEYTHIPVLWDNPTEVDFETFASRLSQAEGKKVLVHCFANYRATAFFSLYAMRELGWSEAQADELIGRVWRLENYPVWDQFIQKMKKVIQGRS